MVFARMKHFVAALLLGLGLGLGCKQQTSAPVAVDEVKGSPIRGEPIRPQVADAATETLATNQTTAEAAVAKLPVSTNLVTSTNIPAPTQKDGEHLVVGFDYLASFSYVMPDESHGPVEGSPEQIPANIRKLDETPIALKGYMLPLKVESGIVTELLLMRDQSMCCYGSVPLINEWVSVKMGAGVKPVMDAPVTIYGKLQVGEVRENGYLVGLYQMDGQRMKEE